MPYIIGELPVSTQSECVWELLTKRIRVCYTDPMPLQTIVQLHIILVMTPALAAWILATTANPTMARIYGPSYQVRYAIAAPNSRGGRVRSVSLRVLSVLQQSAFQVRQAPATLSLICREQSRSERSRDVDPSSLPRAP